MDHEAFLRLVREWDAAVVSASNASDWWEVQGREPRGSVLRPPAPPETVAALEERIGRFLPGSFRWFLQVSDGADAAVERVCRPEEGLLPAAQIDWFIRRSPRLPHLRPMLLPEGWFEPDNDPHDGEVSRLSALFVGGQAGTPTGHLPHCLAVSGSDGEWAVLLNPLVRDADGEWECVEFFTHDTAMGHRSFADFLASRRDRLVGMAARHERLDADDLDGVDDAAIERWLTSWHVAPPWFWRQLRSPHPPARAVAVLGRLLDAGPRMESARHVARMQGPVAYELAQRAWRAAESGAARSSQAAPPRPGPSSSVTADMMDVASQLSWSRDPGVRAWLVDVLATHLRADPRLVASLRSIDGAVVEQLWHRSGGDELLTELVRVHQWLRVEDKTGTLEAVAAKLADADWRERHSEHLGALVDALATGDRDVLPLLRELRQAPEVPARNLAKALLLLGDEDIAYAVQHLTIGEVDWLTRVPGDVRAAHRRERARLVVGGGSGERGRGFEELLDALAGHSDPEATDLLVAVRGRVEDVGLAVALERQRTSAAADALLAIAEDEPHAWRCLARLGDSRAAEPLLALLDHDDPHARLFAARGLRELGSPRPIGQLVARAGREPEPDLLCVAAHTAVVHGVDATDLLSRLEALGGGSARLSAHWRTVAGP